MAGQIKGILCLMVAMAILAFTDGLSKYLTGGYPPGEIMFFAHCSSLFPSSL